MITAVMMIPGSAFLLSSVEMGQDLETGCMLVPL